LYVEILLSKENIDFQKETLQRNNKILIETKNLLKQGFNTPVDTLKVHIEVKNTENEILKSNNQLKMLKINLQKIINYDQDFEVVPVEVESTVTNTFELNVTDRTENKIAKVNNEIAILEEERVKALYYPKINLIGQFQKQSQADDYQFNQYQWPENYFLGVEIKIPIFAGFYNSTKSQQAKLQKEQSIIRQSQTERNGLLDVEIAKNDVENAKLRIQNSKNTLEASKRSFELSNQQFKKGLIKYGDLLDSELAIKQSNLGIISAKYDLWLATFNLEKLSK
jgi:outer membrane protein TolC